MKGFTEYTYDVWAERIIRMQNRKWRLAVFKPGYAENYKRRKLRVVGK